MTKTDTRDIDATVRQIDEDLSGASERRLRCRAALHRFSSGSPRFEPSAMIARMVFSVEIVIVLAFLKSEIYRV